MAHSRRDFLVGGLATGAALPLVSGSPLLGMANMLSASGRILVVLQLDGGWDYFNQIIPVYSKEYYEARPTIGVKDKSGSTLPISSNVSEKWPVYAQPLKDLFDRGDLADMYARVDELAVLECRYCMSRENGLRLFLAEGLLVAPDEIRRRLRRYYFF